MKHLFVILNVTMMSLIQLNAQSWVDASLYPFQSNFLELESGKIHYVDEGEGEVILFVHGTPTWSFLYRDFIRQLSQTHRCIAIDHLGFGLSDKNPDFIGTPQNHAKNLAAVINELELDRITLVVHDFGGAIGLSAALDQPEKIERIVLFNSWLWATKDDPVAQEIDALLNSEAGKAYYLKQNYSPQVLLKQAFSNPDKLSQQVHDHYLAPFPNPQSRQTLLTLGQNFVGASDWYEEQWQQLDRLQNKEWLILWGIKDPFLNQNYLNKWSQKFKNATVRKFNCGHFVQEEEPQEAITAMKLFLSSSVEKNQ